MKKLIPTLVITIAVGIVSLMASPEAKAQYAYPVPAYQVEEDAVQQCAGEEQFGLCVASYLSSAESYYRGNGIYLVNYGQTCGCPEGPQAVAVGQYTLQQADILLNLILMWRFL